MRNSYKSPCMDLARLFTGSVPTLKNDIFAATKLATILEDNAEKFIAAYELALVAGSPGDGRPPDQILCLEQWSWTCTTTVDDFDASDWELP